MSIRQEFVPGEIISNFPHFIQFIIIGELIEFGSLKKYREISQTYMLGGETEWGEKYAVIQ